MNRMTDFRGKPVPQSTIVRLAMIINVLFLLGLTSSSTSLRDPGTSSGVAVGTDTGVGGASETGSDGVVAGGEAAEPGAASPDGTVVLPSGERVPAANASGGAGRTGTTGGGSGGGASTNTTGGIERVGQGVSADTINIGITLFKVGGFGAAFGAGSVDFGDTEAQARAAVNHINETGGIAGRKVNPIFYTFDFGRPGLADGQSEQEACSLWTEDNKTFAVINYVMARHALMTCLAARDVPGIHMGMPIDEGLLSKHRRYWYAGNNGAGLTLERQAAVQAKVYGDRGWFGKDAVVGIQYFDDPAYKKVVDEQFIPNIKKYGVQKFVLQAAPRGGSDGAQYAARFQREGVTHVLFLGEAALYPIFFMQGAENQGYRPKYGITTDMAPAVLLQITVPERQLENAIGVGWQPMSDTDADNDPGPVSPRQTLCHDVMRKAGQDMSKRGAALTALNYCSGLWMLQDSLKTTKDITSVGLERALEGLGNRWVSPVVYGTDFAYGHDGVTKYRDLAFKDGAFYYSSGVKDMPR